MIQYIKKLIKRDIVKRRLLKIKHMYDVVDPGVLADTKTCVSICRNAIKHPKSEFFIAPLSDERYIKNSKLGIFVILDDKKISIINHVFYYSNILLTDRDWRKMTNMYDNKTESIRQELKNQMKSQIKHSLDIILNKMNRQPKEKTPVTED
jgi:hypothetical protein